MRHVNVLYSGSSKSTFDGSNNGLYTGAIVTYHFLHSLGVKNLSDVSFFGHDWSVDNDKVVEELKLKISEGVKFPTGYYVTYGGQFKNQQEASRLMITFGIIALAFVFLLLFSYFKSSFITLQIMLSIPLAIIGSVVAIYITDKTISIALRPTKRQKVLKFK